MKLLLIAALLLSGSAYAMQADGYLGAYDLSSNFNMVAQIVSSTSSVSDKQVGQIIYDLISNQFKGLDSAGVWDARTDISS
jgi:hypothetical protein